MTAISKEEENNVKLYLLLFKISPRAVHAVFDHEFNPSCLNASIKKSTNFLEDLRNRKIINQSQWKLLFPRQGDPDSKTFDVTLMVTLLTNLTNLDHYPNLPLETDTSRSADLARIRIYRNHISHVTLNEDGKIESTYFTMAWDNISAAIGRLGGQDMKSECNELRTKCFDASTVPPWNIRVQIMKILEDWQLNDVNFVQTRAAKKVLECIEKNSCVSIIASSGVGKTATLRHVSLTMEKAGYNILLVTSPHDIVKFNNPYQKTLYVIDDFCGTYSINKSYYNNLETVLGRIKELLKNKLTKIIVACRLQVYKDKRFQSLSIFSKYVCNLQSEVFCLSHKEKQAIAESYLEKNASDIIEYCDLYDCFPLLCKLYSDNSEYKIIDFFKNPFSLYETEIDNLYKKRHNKKYCVLALLVMFNNQLKEEWLTEEVSLIIRTIIENTCEECRLVKGTPRLVLFDELKSLEHTFIKKEQGVYKTKHDKIFDFFVAYFGKKMIQCLIRNADGEVIGQRFLLERTDDMDQSITVLPTKYHEMYIQRMVDDWSKGSVRCVFKNINMKIPEFRQRFLCHIKSSDISIQRKLAQIRDINYNDTVLQMCCSDDDINFIKWCINQSVDVNHCDRFGTSPLYVSAQEGHIEIVKILIANNANIDKCTDAGLSPFVIACFFYHKKVVKLLLDNKADINKCMEEGISVLHIACQYQDIDMVKFLLDNKADINKCTDQGNSPLSYACENNRMDIVKLLLDNHADINMFKRDGSSPLCFACQNNNIEIVKILLDNNADINMCLNNGASPLCIACYGSHMGVVTVLLENNADINISTNDGVSPLFLACQKNNIEIVKVLFEVGAKINKCDNEGCSPLFIASQKNHIEVVKFLLDKQADINECRIDGSSPLFAASMNNNIETVKILLQNKADINKCNDKDVSPLCIACEKNHIELVKILLENNADVNKCIYNGESPLSRACQNNYLEIVKILLENNADINKRDNKGVSPLYAACQNNSVAVVQVLLENKADINSPTIVGSYPLIEAYFYNRKEVLKVLMENTADIYTLCDNGKCLWILACKNQDMEMVNFLLDKADINKCIDIGASHLSIACDFNCIDIVKVLLDKNSDINMCLRDGSSPLFIACQNNSINVVKFLLDNKADIDKCIENGASPLFMASQKNHIEVVKVLLDNQADINKCRIDGSSPLFAASMNNHIETVKILLQNKADINKCNDEDISPLCIACEKNHIELVKILLDNNADINKCIYNGESPLSRACQNNCLEIVKILLENNADINKRDNKGVSPLYVACQNNSVAVVKVLLENKADINKGEDVGLSPLSIAVENNHTEIVKILLDYKHRDDKVPKSCIVC